MHRSNRSAEAREQQPSDDRGSASLEFITVGLLLLVPLVYLVIALGQVQGQALGAESAARHIARVLAQAPDAETGARRADAVLTSIAEEYGMDRAALGIRISCTPAGAVCPQAGATMTVTVSTTVTLPLAPSVLELDRVLAIPIEASASQKVSRYWGGS